jgi:hypothetical protein
MLGLEVSWAMQRVATGGETSRFLRAHSCDDAVLPLHVWRSAAGMTLRIDLHEPFGVAGNAPSL